MSKMGAQFEIAQNPLLVESVVEHIFQYLSISTLTKCRLVCKIWSDESIRRLKLESYYNFKPIRLAKKDDFQKFTTIFKNLELANIVVNPCVDFDYFSPLVLVFIKKFQCFKYFKIKIYEDELPTFLSGIPPPAATTLEGLELTIFGKVGPLYNFSFHKPPQFGQKMESVTLRFGDKKSALDSHILAKVWRQHFPLQNLKLEFLTPDPNPVNFVFVFEDKDLSRITSLSFNSMDIVAIESLSELIEGNRGLRPNFLEIKKLVFNEQTTPPSQAQRSIIRWTAAILRLFDLVQHFMQEMTIATMTGVAPNINFVIQLGYGICFKNLRRAKITPQIVFGNIVDLYHFPRLSKRDYKNLCKICIKNDITS